MDLGIGPYMTFGLSVIIFGGASQIVLLQLFSGGASSLVILSSVGAVNSRHFLYGAVLSENLSNLMLNEKTVEKKLSRAAIETLSIIVYHQPVTRAEIEEIRGVSVSRGTVDQLLEMDWIRFGRRRMTPGRPVTFVMTQTFLDHFGLETTKDLPGLKDLRAAGLLESRVPPGIMSGSDIEDEDDDSAQSDMFEDE